MQEIIVVLVVTAYSLREYWEYSGLISRLPSPPLVSPSVSLSQELTKTEKGLREILAAADKAKNTKGKQDDEMVAEVAFLKQQNVALRKEAQAALDEAKSFREKQDTMERELGLMHSRLPRVVRQLEEALAELVDTKAELVASKKDLAQILESAQGGAPPPPLSSQATNSTDSPALVSVFACAFACVCVCVCFKC